MSYTVTTCWQAPGTVTRTWKKADIELIIHVDIQLVLLQQDLTILLLIQILPLTVPVDRGDAGLDTGLSDGADNVPADLGLTWTLKCCHLVRRILLGSNREWPADI